MKLSYNPSYPARPSVIVAIHVAEPQEASRLVKTVETRLYPDYSKDGHPFEVIYLDTKAGKNTRINVKDHNEANLPPSSDKRTKAYKKWLNSQRVWLKVTKTKA